jgi:hypothetical protein
VWRHAVESLGTIAVTDEWSIVSVLHCSHIVDACLHALHALTMLLICKSCRSMMTLMLDALETSVCALGTCMPIYTGMSARLFFILEAHGPQGAAGHVATSEPTPVGR